jgi:hypothetical protein
MEVVKRDEEENVLEGTFQKNLYYYRINGLDYTADYIKLAQAAD